MVASVLAEEVHGQGAEGLVARTCGVIMELFDVNLVNCNENPPPDS